MHFRLLHIRLNKIGILGHTVEGRIGILQKICGRGKLCDHSLVQHNNLIGVHNRIQSVSNCKHGAILKFTANRFLQEEIGLLMPNRIQYLFTLQTHLDKIIRLQIDSCCGFIQHKHLGFPQQRTCQTNQLTLTH